MEGKIAIRLANRGEVGTVLAVINRTNRRFYKAIVPSERFKDPFMGREELVAEFGRKDLFVYELEDRVVGVVAYEPRGRDVGVLDRLYVLPEFHRRKIGTALVSHVEGRAKSQGIREILLWTDVEAAWAVSFYKRLGYHEIDPGDIYSDEYIDARIRQHGHGLLVLRKPLSVE